MNSQDQIRRLAASRQGGIWVAEFTRYHFERRDSSGHLQQQLFAAPDWFGGTPLQPGLLSPPPSEIMGMQEDAYELLWVVSRRADPQWKSAMIPTQGPHGRSYRVGSYEQFYDSVLDVIDPHTGARVVTATWKGYALAFVADGVVASYDDAGPTPRLSLWRLTLLTPPSRKP